MTMLKINAVCLLLFSCILPPGVQAWSGRTHFWINSAAAIRADRTMPGWIAYKETLARLSIGPDLWKEFDPEEGPRHYINIEFYGYPAPLVLDPVNPGLLNERTGTTTSRPGIIPWVIVELIDRLAAEMAATNWTEAIRVAGALGHYVGDIQMPLHVTSNFDGWDTGNEGIHARWELDMPRLHMRGRRVPDGDPVYIGNLWGELTNWIVTAHRHVPAILAADTKATGEVLGDFENPQYHALLWRQTSDIFFQQIDRAAETLSSVWYTAWVRAGQPAIPPLPDNISDKSVFIEPVLATGGALDASYVFFAALILAGAVILWKSLRK